MDITFLILVFFFCITFPLYRWYSPKIEIVPLVKHYKVYLWYNKWEGAEYKGRTYKHLFDI